MKTNLTVPLAVLLLGSLLLGCQNALVEGELETTEYVQALEARGRRTAEAAAEAPCNDMDVIACEAMGARLNERDDWTAEVPDRLMLPAFSVTTPDASADQPGTEPQAQAGGGSDASDLAKAAQNPIADMISLPFQYNLNFGAGPENDVLGVLNIQPVIPVNLGPVNVVNRFILPVMHGSNAVFGKPGDGTEFGLGDLNYTAFFSPAKPGKLIWGVGPTMTFPTATDDALGSRKWSIGPSAVFLTMNGPWVIGALVSNQWSFAGDSDRASVNTFLLNPFINYNLAGGWYISTSPVITANWNAEDKWTVPVGGGVGRTFMLGRQPVNISARAYYNVVKPDHGADWTLQLQMTLLFPK
jgi:hypothetical protein